MQKLKRIGIMGGTFNPIHIGHLIIAEETRRKFNLDKVIFIPTGEPPHKNKDKLVPALDRYIMTILATIENQYFLVSDIETNREGTSYTIDTIKAFKNIYKDSKLFFITGADAILDIENWKDTEELLNMCTFIAATRPGYDLNEVNGQIKKLEKKYNNSISFLTIAPIDVSSTQIRNRIKESKTIKYMTTNSVINYINQKDFYK